MSDLMSGFDKTQRKERAEQKAADPQPTTPLVEGSAKTLDAVAYKRTEVAPSPDIEQPANPGVGEDPSPFSVGVEPVKPLPQVVADDVRASQAAKRAAPRAAEVKPVVAETGPQKGRTPTGRKKRTFYLPAAVMEELKRRTATGMVTYAEVVLSEFDNWFERLTDIFPPLPVRRSPLPNRKPPARSRVPGLTPVHLMLDEAECAVLEDARASLALSTWSELISGVLEAAFNIDVAYRRPLRSALDEDAM